MKNQFVLIVALFLSLGLYAQEKFTVPEVPVEQKYRNMLGQLNGMVAVGIQFAKKQGLSASDYGKYTGNQFKYSWNKDAGFDGFVKGMMRIITVFVPDPNIEIITNTPEKVKFKSGLMSIQVKKNEPYYGITYKEFMEFFITVTSTIGNYLGSETEVTYDEDWMYITLTKIN